MPFLVHLVLPYKVELNDLYRPVSLNTSLDDLSEQEVLFLDLTEPVVINSQSTPKITPSTNTFFSKSDKGKIDPRPIAMFGAREFFDRIYENGGIFIVFSAPPVVQSIYWGTAYRSETNLEISSWSFLSVLENLHKALRLWYGNYCQG